MDKIIELAKQAGAVSYTNRHYPDRPYRTFGPEELQKFYNLARADLEAELALVNESNAQLRDQNETLDSLMRDLEAENAAIKIGHEASRTTMLEAVAKLKQLEAEIFRLREHIIDQTKLEQEINQLRKERQAFKDVTEYQKAENAKLNSTLEDILFHIEEAMRNEVQPYEVEMAAKRARAALGEK